MKFQSTTSRQCLLLFVHDKDIFVNKKIFFIKITTFFISFYLFILILLSEGRACIPAPTRKKDNKNLKKFLVLHLLTFCSQNGWQFCLLRQKEYNMLIEFSS